MHVPAGCHRMPELKPKVKRAHLMGKCREPGCDRNNSHRETYCETHYYERKCCTPGCWVLAKEDGDGYCGHHSGRLRAKTKEIRQQERILNDYVPKEMLGRCIDGTERFGVYIVHAVSRLNTNGASLCNTAPGKKLSGWSEPLNEPVSCKRCLALLEKRGWYSSILQDIETVRNAITNKTTLEAFNRLHPRETT